MTLEADPLWHADPETMPCCCGHVVRSHQGAARCLECCAALCPDDAEPDEHECCPRFDPMPAPAGRVRPGDGRPLVVLGRAFAALVRTLRDG